ncbi:glycosyltransferase [Gangjinia marincola]|uniref:Glycosyltransferase n=1 Tax=Gangjinia marincola TaxID=578463 RepID=A0ABP3XUU5_9FLAO
MSEVIFWLFAALIAINCIYYLSFFKLAFHRNPEPRDQSFGVSIVICAKNEVDALQGLLPKLLQQDYPNFQVVLINDSSNDGTLEVMQRFADQDNRVDIVDVKNNEAFWGNKKYALTLGIKKTRYNHLLFIDADCQPFSDQWIGEMMGQFSERKDIILGYGAYHKKSSFLNKLIRFETLLTATQYLNYSLWGNPYMGVGRNLAYKKELFFENNGFVNHIKLKSGDDDLFINEVAKGSNTAICISPQSFTYSIPKVKYVDWIRQKRRHVSTAVKYKRRDKFLLSLFYISQLSFWIALPLLFLFSPSYLSWFFIVFSIRLVIQWSSMGSIAKKLKEQDLIVFLPFLELILIIHQLLIFSANIVSKPTYWK